MTTATRLVPTPSSAVSPIASPIATLTLALITLLSIPAVSCVIQASNRFPADVATALRSEPMRRMETQSLVLYYPEGRRQDAVKIGQRLEGCTKKLRARAQIHSPYTDQKMIIVVPDLPFNNASVSPDAIGSEAFSLIPTSNTLDYTTELGLPPDPAYVSCHEIVHYVHTLQLKGPWRWANAVFGSLIPTQTGLDPWFSEGLATFYESQFQPGTGRMAWPVWRGFFHAGFAGKRLNGGDFSNLQRPFHWSNHYLAGSHFVSFIAERYGEKALWKLIERQGGSWLFPFGVALRWKTVTGKSLPALLDEFSDYVGQNFPVAARPAGQTVVRSAGESARYAVAETGREALIVSSGDLPATLRIYDGKKLTAERRLNDILWPRTLANGSVLGISGLSFTRDGNRLYFVAIDSGPIEQEARLLRYDVKRGQLDVVMPRLGGIGGGVSRDGSHYYYGYADGNRHHLAVLDLATKQPQIVRPAEIQTYYGTAHPSPDGSLIASSVFDGKRHVIRILDAQSGRTVKELAPPHNVHDPSWINNRELLVLVEAKQKFQVHRYNIETSTLKKLTEAPYLAFQPRFHQGAVRFLNREGWTWTVDEVLLHPESGFATVALNRQSQPPNWPHAPSGQPLHAAPKHIDLPKHPDSPHSALISITANPVSEPLQIISDQPYRHTDRLLYPALRFPMFYSADNNVGLIGLSLTGSDRLSFHNWSVFWLYESRGGKVSGGAQYSTSLLAPYTLRFALNRFAWNKAEKVGTAFEAGSFRSKTQGQLSLSRSFRDTSATLLLEAAADTDRDNPQPILHERRLVGPRLSGSHAALEQTPYGGIRRGFSLTASTAFFSRSLSSFSRNITDVSGEFKVWVPLPLSTRHQLSFSLRGRRFIGIDRNQGFLEVGGDSALFRSVQGRPDDFDKPTLGDTAIPDQLSFTEQIRGFADLPFLTDRIAIGEVTYRYPLIVDFGYSSIAYLLPSIFFRQIDLELFGVAATNSFKQFEHRRKIAAGGSMSLLWNIGAFPFFFRYQLARRFTDDNAWVHSITMGL